MKKTIASVAAIAALAVPAAAAGHGHGAVVVHRVHIRAALHPAVHACRVERKADKTAFRQKYANKRGKHAMRRCVAQHVRQARRTCRTERKADRTAFRQKYANKRGKRAFVRCVRQHEGDPVS